MGSAEPRPEIQHYRELVAINRMITSSLDHVVVLDTVVRQAARLLRGDAATLLLAEGERLAMVAEHGLPHLEQRLAMGPGLMAAIRELGDARGLRGCVGVPLVRRDQTIGVLAVYRRTLDAPFEDDEELLSALADQAAIALDNARVYDQSQAHAEALRESEERFRKALDEAPIGMALVGLDGRFLRVNAALCQIVGYPPAELTALTFQQITHPDDVGADVELAQRLARGDIPRYQLSKRYLRKDGTPVQILLTGSVVRGTDGAPLYFIAQVEDLSERLRTEALASQAQRRYELALRGADLATWDWNVETGEVSYNARWAEMRGERPEEIRPHIDTWLAGIHPDDLAAVQHVLTEHFEGRRSSYESEHRVRTRAGDWIWVLDRGSVFARDEQGRPIRMVGMELDITPRKHAERELSRLVRRLRVVLEEVPVGILLSYDGRTWHANNCAMTMFGQPQPPSLDATPYIGAVLGPDERALAPDQFPGARALHGEKLDHVELRLRRPDGHVIPVLVNAAPIPTEEEAERGGAVVAFEDISTLKELERLRNEWSSIVAHDLRQPLNHITLQAELVAEQAKDHPAVQRRVEQIRDSARRLGRMIQDLLDFSMLEASQLRLQRRHVDLAGMVAEVTQRLGLGAPDRHIDVHVRGEPLTVDVDPDRFDQIMENLLTNAIKYGDPGTPIHIEAGPCNEGVAIAVTNYGSGISKGHVPHLFQRFRTIDEARRVGVRGIGLGLYITRSLVEAHGGRIDVESTPGGATTFRFTLPVVDRANQATDRHP